MPCQILIAQLYGDLVHACHRCWSRNYHHPHRAYRPNDLVHSKTNNHHYLSYNYSLNWTTRMFSEREDNDDDQCIWNEKRGQPISAKRRNRSTLRCRIELNEASVLWLWLMAKSMTNNSSFCKIHKSLIPFVAFRGNGRLRHCHCGLAVVDCCLDGYLA